MTGCNYYSPCSFAQRLEKRGEEDRGKRDQQITALEKQVRDLERQLVLAKCSKCRENPAWCRVHNSDYREVGE
jgi:hypothetical protein